MILENTNKGENGEMSEVIKFSYHHIIDLKGCFTFETDGFEISSFGKKRYIRYSEVTGVTRLFYDRPQTVVNVTIHAANPNKYRIELANGKNIDFCVAHKEEDSYKKAIARLNKEIFGINRLGVQFRLKTVDEITQRQREKEFERRMPPRDYSLEKAIAVLVRRCALELDDQTAYKSPEQEAVRNDFASARDEAFAENSVSAKNERTNKIITVIVAAAIMIGIIAYVLRDILS